MAEELLPDAFGLQPFEAFPDLASHLARMASTGNVGSTNEWCAFTDALNTALSRPSYQPLMGDREKIEKTLRDTLKRLDVRVSRAPTWLASKLADALASLPAQVGEPVAWRWRWSAGSWSYGEGDPLVGKRFFGGAPDEVQPLFAHPVPEQDGWRDISTAPKDGTPILAVDYGDISVVSWTGREWTALADGRYAIEAQSDLGTDYVEPNPSHWQPLPVPPLPEQEAV